jgi:hypothetical protein
VVPFPDLGFALAHTDADVAATDGSAVDLTDDELAYLLGGESLHVVSTDGTTFAARWSTPAAAPGALTSYPVDVDAGFTGPGVLVTADGETVGIVGRVNHRNVLHLLGTVLARISANAGG